MSTNRRWTFPRASIVAVALVAAAPAFAQVAVKGKTLYTMTGGAGQTIKDGVVVFTGGKVAAVGPAASVQVPAGYRVLEAAVVTPGLIDAHGTVGVSGMLNQKQDQDQLERSNPLQPELRAIDAYNPNDKLVEWVRSFGVTTVHTGHAPGELISGQTCIVKTVGKTIDDAVLVEAATVACTLGPWAQKDGKESPGTRAKMVAMLRDQLIKAKEYAEKRAKAEKGEAPEDQGEAKDGKDKKKDPSARNLRLEMLGRVLAREVPLLVTANRSIDIASALRLAREFNIRIILDSGSESYLLIDELKAAQVPVIIHPTMFRMFGEMENMSVETAGKLAAAGIPVAMQSGYESYVPKTRVVLLEAAIAAANGMTFERALATVTTDAAKILGIDGRVGALKVGLDADAALYDGDPFEYTSHCVGVVINGQVVSEVKR